MEIGLITKYIASWNWFILSNIYLVGGLISLSFETFYSDIMGFAFLSGFALSLFLSYKRRGGLKWVDQEKA